VSTVYYVIDILSSKTGSGKGTVASSSSRTTSDCSFATIYFNAKGEALEHSLEGLFQVRDYVNVLPAYREHLQDLSEMREE